MPASASAPAARRRHAGAPAAGLRRLWRDSDNARTYLPLLAAILALGAYASAESELFLTARNVQVLLESVAVLGLLTVGTTLLLAAGQLDLSIGAAAALSAVVGAKLISGGTSTTVAVIVMLALPVAIAATVALVVVVTRVQPFILTLGLLSVLQAVSLLQTGQRPVSVGSNLQSLSTADVLGVPVSFWLFVLALLVGGVILRYARLGRSAYAVGSNEQAAFLAGIPVGRVKLALFALSGLTVGAAGVVLLSNLGAGDASSGSGLELQAIAAAVIGGAALGGGRGSMFGSFLGVMLLGLVTNALTLLDVSSFQQQLVQGGLLITAVLLTAIAERLRADGRGLRSILATLLRRPTSTS
ncbi:MAG: ABC-type transporter, integral rane subunit [Solirubrobacterales bacterium]|jgi:ribose transport system permease protein|nr:ABC-type transporter, integral rane subunit [Solirubrobacterales bacterium]